LTEIYRCHACSGHETLRVKTARAGLFEVDVQQLGKVFPMLGTSSELTRDDFVDTILCDGEP
jgi:hypothetical protein